MVEALIGVFGALVGIGITVFTNWLGQRREFGRSAKRELYAQFISALWSHNVVNQKGAGSSGASLELLKSGTQISLYASDRVVRCVAEVMKHKGSIGLVGRDKIVELSVAMRDDLGLQSGSDLTSEIHDIWFARVDNAPSRKGSQ